MLPQNARLTLLAREIRIHLENILRLEELNMLRQIGIAKILEPREQGLREFFRAHDNFPDFADDCLEEIEIALLGNDHALPIPLVDISRVIVIQEIVFPHGLHIGADALAQLALKLLQSDPSRSHMSLTPLSTSPINGTS